MEYEFSLPTPPDELRAIGIVAVEWSYLESLIDAAIAILGNMFEEDRAEAILTHLAVPVRLNILATLVDLQSQDGTSTKAGEFSRLKREIVRLAAARNRVVHSRWVYGSQGSPMVYAVQARGELRRSREALPAAEMLAIARDIANLANDLRSFFDIPY